MQEKQGRTVAQLLRSVGRLLIIALALLMTLNQFINIGPILAGAGILGLAVSFGAQSLVKDVINGFFMLVENSISRRRHRGHRGQDGHRGAGDAARGAPARCRRHAARHPERADHHREQPDAGLVARRGRRRRWPTNPTSTAPLACSARRRPGSPPTRLWSKLLDGTPEVLGVQQLAERGVTIRTLLRTQPGQAVGGGARASGSASRTASAASASPSPLLPQRVGARWRREPHRSRRAPLPSSPGVSHDAAPLQHADAPVEPFAPLAPPRVTLYTCGPTVWNFAHIGNFRTFLFEDLLRRWLEASGLRGVPRS